ncbi:hypothetical protein ElyMa_006080500 [Elysia marginata]|uniref:FZ domain-containing protein n=1 Tax=Elysia marginata TaxID=1093978 RepID=A0AAV4GQQ1_9GAST|nr:hypothetical protein ElyMa_006080500 [Elysia marginata]
MSRTLWTVVMLAALFYLCQCTGTRNRTFDLDISYEYEAFGTRCYNQVRSICLQPAMNNLREYFMPHFWNETLKDQQNIQDFAIRVAWMSSCIRRRVAHADCARVRPNVPIWDFIRFADTYVNTPDLNKTAMRREQLQAFRNSPCFQNYTFAQEVLSTLTPCYDTFRESVLEEGEMVCYFLNNLVDCVAGIGAPFC